MTADNNKLVNQTWQGRALIAEDNLINQALAKRILGKFGMTVTVVENGQQAVDLAREEPFDIIFMDCQMPVLDGYDATRLIRANEGNNRRVPIIALTANSLKGEEIRSKDAGMDYFLTKPYTQQDIAQILAKFLEAKSVITDEVEGAAETSSDVIDIDLAQQSYELLGEDFEDMIDMQHEAALKAQREMALMLEQTNFTELARIAHSTKGSYYSLGGKQVADVLAAIEKEGKADNPSESDISQLLIRLETAIPHYQAEVSKIIQGFNPDILPGGDNFNE